MKGREQIQYVSPEQLTLRPQVRSVADDDSIYEIADSLREVGVLHPVRVRKENDQLVVTDGERRTGGAQLIGLREIPVIIEERDLCPAEVIQHSLIANCQRKNLSGLEAARAIRALMKATGWNASETAGKLGFSNATVSRLLVLLSLPEAIQSQVEAGAIPPSTAYEIAKTKDTTMQQKMASAAANGKTRDEIAILAKAAQPEAVPVTPAPTRIKARVAGGSVTIAAPSLTAESLIAMLTELLAKVRKLKSRGVPIESFACSLRKSVTQ